MAERKIILHGLREYILIIACIIFLSCFVLPSPVLGADLETNLLQNGNGDLTYANDADKLMSNHGWTGGNTINWYAYPGDAEIIPVSPNYFLGYYNHPVVYGTSSYSTYQDVDVSSQAGKINAGQIIAELTGYIQKTGSSSSSAKIGLQALDAGGNLTSLGEYTSTTLGSWQAISIREGVPTNTIALRVILTGIDIKGGYIAFDDLALKLKQDTSNPPAISAIDNQSNNSGETLGPIAFTISDADTDVNALTVNITSDNTTLIPAANISKTANGGNCTVSFTSVSGNTGSATITIAVSDGNKTTYQLFTVTVYPNVQVGSELLINGNCSSLTGWKGSEISRFTSGTKFVVSTILEPTSEIYIYQNINLGKFAVPIDAGLLNYTAVINSSSTGKLMVEGLNSYGSVIWTSNSGKTASGTIAPQTRSLQVYVGGAVNTWVDDISCIISGANLPNMTAIANQNIDIGASKKLDFVVAYAGNSISLNAVSSNAELLPDTNLVLDGSGYNRSISITPIVGKSGSAVVTISSNGTVLQTFTVVVNKTDQYISGTTTYNKTYGDSNFALDCTANTEVTYTVTSGESFITLTGDTVTINGTGTATITASAAASDYYNAAGDLTITVNIAAAIKPIPVNALNFDGVDDYVMIADNDDNISAFTIETWVKWDPDSPADIQFICGKGVEQMELHTGSNNDIRFIPTSGVLLDATNVLPVGIWTHIAVVYDPTAASAKMYVNGNEVPLTNHGSNALSTAVGNTSTSFFLGRRSDGSYSFKGSLDELRIWNRVRSQQEILTDYVNELDVAAPSGLVSCYHFNQGIAGGNNAASTILPDLTGNYNGTLTNFALKGSSSNWVDSEAWAGVNTYTVTYDNNGATSGTVPNDNRQYVEGAAASVKGGGQLVRTGYTFGGWNTTKDGSGSHYAENSSLVVGSDNVILYAQWDGVVVAANATAGGDALVNSVEQADGFKVVAQCSHATSTLYVVPSGTALNSDAIILAAIGNQVSAGAFTDTTIAISANHTGVVDGTAYQVYAIDGAGNISASGTAFTVNLAAPIEKYKALKFDGSDDYVSLADNDENISALTMESWVKWEPVSPTDVQFICGKGSEQMELHTGGGAGANGIRFIPTTGVYLDAVSVLPVGVWTHVAVVYQPSTELAKMYINGNEAALSNKGANPLSTPVGNTSVSFNLGIRSSISYPFKGTLDDFRIWNRVLTQNEIRLDMINNPVGTELQTGLVSSYGFNDGIVGADNTARFTLTDATGNFNGTLNHFALSGTSSNWVAGDASSTVPGYTVTYDANEATSGTVPVDSFRYVQGAQAKIKENSGSLARTGYTFAGWKTADVNGTVYHSGDNFTMEAATATLYAQWTIIPTTGTISGTVTDGSNPVEGATVSTTVSDKVYSATTSADGSYTIENVPAGSGYSLTAAKDGYQSNSKTNVSVTAGAATTDADITITAVDQCFIATAAFGSKLQSAVVLLRQFRDRILMPHVWGRAFVDFYYRHSPPIAAYIAGSEPLKALVRVLLLPLIAAAYLLLHPLTGWGCLGLLIIMWLLKKRVVVFINE